MRQALAFSLARVRQALRKPEGRLTSRLGEVRAAKGDCQADHPRAGCGRNTVGDTALAECENCFPRKAGLIGS